MISYHSKWRGFRRSLRHLAVEDARVRAARAVARLSQIAALKALPGRKKISDQQLAAALLKLERLCDGVAENEFHDMGVTRSDAHKRSLRLCAKHTVTKKELRLREDVFPLADE